MRQRSILDDLRTKEEEKQLSGPHGIALVLAGCRRKKRKHHNQHFIYPADLSPLPSLPTTTASYYQLRNPAFSPSISCEEVNDVVVHHHHQHQHQQQVTVADVKEVGSSIPSLPLKRNPLIPINSLPDPYKMLTLPPFPFLDTLPTTPMHYRLPFLPPDCAFDIRPENRSKRAGGMHTKKSKEKRKKKEKRWTSPPLTAPSAQPQRFRDRVQRQRRKVEGNITGVSSGGWVVSSF